MIRYLLDTNACIALMKENAGVVARVREVGMESLLLCAPSEKRGEVQFPPRDHRSDRCCTGPFASGALTPKCLRLPARAAFSGPT
jgi:hypothetical protein